MAKGVHDNSSRIGLHLTLVLTAWTAADAGDGADTPPCRLCWPASHGDVDEVKSLLAAKADPNARDELGNTPLLLAAQQDHAEMAKLLLANGADPNSRQDAGHLLPFKNEENGDTPLHVAAFDGHAAVIQVLLEGKADPNAELEYGMTPLHLAVRRGHLEATRALLAGGANPNARTMGATALVQAIRGMRGQPPPRVDSETARRIIHLLLAAKADSNSGLIEAAASCDADLARLFLRNGADPSAARPRLTMQATLMSAAEKCVLESQFWKRLQKQAR